MKNLPPAIPLAGGSFTPDRKETGMKTTQLLFTLAFCISATTAFSVRAQNLTVPQHEDVEHSGLGAGETVFFEGSIGVGCNACHGDDARGLIGTDIRGRTAAEIRAASSAVEDMINAQINDLTDDQLLALQAYLASLISDTPPSN
ncbi:MAG: hypothetical protein K0B00_14300 [Rhodobacteraceae bacterium]|nr:hypothetical protein [Paracoccaceae bacterium]